MFFGGRGGGAPVGKLLLSCDSDRGLDSPHVSVGTTSYLAYLLSKGSSKKAGVFCDSLSLDVSGAGLGIGIERLGLAISSQDKFLFISPGLRLGLLFRDGDSARPPTEALSSSIDGRTHLALSDTSGLILILNFFLLSSSSSESLDEKKCFSLEAASPSSPGRRLKPSSSTSGVAYLSQSISP